ncbi:FAD-binding protein [Candidatus Bipolaricaulota bacterium]|nr:FAD-binding protein [Candidatus Bipolaricaulota bacterium]
MKTIEHDLLIVGGGAAGLRAAIEAKNHIDDVAVVSKVRALRSHSVSAQGGIAAPLGNLAENEEDDWKKHFEDTIEGGGHLVDRDACEVLTKNARQNVIELEHLGVPFSRREDGHLDQRAFGGHSLPRALYAADRTGHAILYALYGENVRRDTTFYEEYFVMDLVTEGRTVDGFVGYDVSTGDLVRFEGEAVILATGGCGQAYETTSSGRASTGDGLGVAIRAGVPVKDLEFIQFHPTGLKEKGILVSEAARGEGGYLLNGKGERFMADYEPDSMELAPRDVVVRAMQREINAGRGIDGEDYLHLDLTHFSDEKIKKKIPTIKELALDFAKVDPTQRPIPVQPTAHYCMGGIPTDISGRVQAKKEGVLWDNLYAAGEIACVSVHGANRLGANSLLETITFGKRAGSFAARRAKKGATEVVNSDGVQWWESKLKALLEGNGSLKVHQLRQQLRATMTEHAGVFRDEEGLERALDKIRGLRERYFEDLYLEDDGRKFNTELRAALELENTLEYSEFIVQAAIAREESRGAHFRTDFPDRDDENWLLHSLLRRTSSGEAEVSYTKVRDRDGVSN